MTNTPNVLTKTTADLTFALIMATSRKLVEASNTVREGTWKTWSPLYLAGRGIHVATIGIIGLGKMGATVSRMAKGFNMSYYIIIGRVIKN